jgi:hypothetical protein
MAVTETKGVAHERGEQLFRKVTTPASGGKAYDPCMVGSRPGVMLTDQDADGYATVKFNGSFYLTVGGDGASGGSAVAAGDSLYYDAAPGGGKSNINKDATNGVFYGWAAGAVASTAQTVVIVDLRG